LAISYSTATKNNRLSVALLAGAVTPSAGQSVDSNSSYGVLNIYTTGLATLLASITLQKPSFSISGGVATLLGVPLSGTAAASGTAAVAELLDSSGNVIGSGMTVGITGSDVNLNSTAISVGQTVTLTSGTITAA
jgi:hypothetical protein